MTIISEEEMKNKISIYYENHFDPTPLVRLLNGHPFQFREFGYQSFIVDPTRDTFAFHRNLNFDNPFHLIDWCTRVKPRKLYLGAQYESKIERSIENTVWNSTDLKFDIDLDDSEQIRRKICRCRGKTMCNQCFEIAKEATIFLVEVLDQDFACPRFPCYKNKADIFMSGSKGTHIHYPEIDRMVDEDNREKESDLRRYIIDYLQLVSEPKRRESGESPVKIHAQKIASRSLQKHFDALIAKWFFQKISVDVLKKLQWHHPKKVTKKGYTWIRKGKKIKNQDVVTLINQIRSDLEGDDSLILNKKTLELYGIYYPIFFKNVLWNRYPRYDGPITFDIKRIIKIPNSVDGSTGMIVQKLNYEELWDTRLDDLSTINDFF